MGAGEWSPAGHVDFTANRSSSEGGGTVPATLYVMNDTANLYVGIRVTNATVGDSIAFLYFDGDHDDNRFEEGEDTLYVDALGNFQDRFRHQTTSAPDTSFGGTQEGDEGDADATGYSFYEFSHPLDSADNAHDFSLRAGNSIGFELLFGHCSPCAFTSYPPTGLAEIVIVSGSRVAPDTQLTSGPPEGSGSNKTDPTFQFTGTDEVLQPAELTFECKTDEGAWAACKSPKQLDVAEGRHTFSVRAVDEMLNADQSPEVRNWTVDHTPPSRPVVRGRRSVRQGQRLALRFSARDGGIGGVYFKCSVDSRVLRRCSARYRIKLPPGKHLVRVRAYDRIGNRGPLTTVRVTVKRTRR